MTHALVLHSGGMDSTTCLYLAKRDHDTVESISIDYGQRHIKETQYAKRVALDLGCIHKLIDGPKNLDSMLTDESQEIPSASYSQLPEGVSPTYVPFRNGQLLSIVAALATMQEATHIYFGAHAEDAQNWAYPDCTPEFVGAMANAIYIGTYHKVRLVAPLIHLMKWEIVEMGEKFGVPWKLTWGCYKGEELHCGTCPTCISRKQAFEKAYIPDPTEYQTP